MDICSITQFRNALTTPRIYLRSLTNVIIDHSTLMRNKYFAECSAEINGKSAMLYAPITPHSMDMAHNAISLLDGATEDLSTLTILDREMRCGDDNTHLCSLLMEYVVDGLPLSEALYTMSKTKLQRGLKELDSRLRLADISINHLHPDNIIVDTRSQWHLLRAFYVTQGYGNDSAAMEKLNELIERCSIPELRSTQLLQEPTSSYECATTNQQRHFNIYEDRRRFITPEGVGFKDSHGNIIIDAIYLSASDFIEERAEVESFDHKMGLIDRYGNYIIECKYDRVEFCVDDGSSKVWSDGLVAEFDYFGEQTTPWHEDYT